MHGDLNGARPERDGAPRGARADDDRQSTPLDQTFLFRRTVRVELDRTMPVHTPERLYPTPFRLTTPMPLRVGILRTMHYSIPEIAEMLFISTEAARKYSGRFYSEMAMSPEMARRTVLTWADFLMTGWDEPLRIYQPPRPDAA